MEHTLLLVLKGRKKRREIEKDKEREREKWRERGNVTIMSVYMCLYISLQKAEVVTKCTMISKK